MCAQPILIHGFELDFLGRQVHKYGPEIMIHIQELDFFDRQVHKYGPQILINSCELDASYTQNIS